jgi:hypothetical protein
MFVWILSFLLFLSGCACMRSEQIDANQSLSHVLFEKNCEPVKELAELLYVTGQFDDVGMLPRNLDDMIKVTQRFTSQGGWRRPEGAVLFRLNEENESFLKRLQERWEQLKVIFLQSDDAQSSDDAKFIGSCKSYFDKPQGYDHFIRDRFKRLGYFREQEPAKKHYNYAIILGATVPSVVARLEYLASCWQKDIRFDEIIFLGSTRLLDEKRDGIPLQKWGGMQILPEQTEIWMMAIVYKNVILPEKMRNVPVRFIQAPPRSDGRYANTGDTLRAWLDGKQQITTEVTHWLEIDFERESDKKYESPKAGNALFISHQPWVMYQDTVIRSYVPLRFVVETVGPESEGDDLLIKYFDFLTRVLYQERVRRKVRQH